MKTLHTLKVGLFGIGLEAYWEQFDGLKEKLESYIKIVSDKIKKYEVTIVDIGLIDNAEKAMEAGHQFRQADVDIIFCTSPRMLYHQLFCPLCKEQRFR